MNADAHALAPIASILKDQVRLYGRAAELSQGTGCAAAIVSVRDERQGLLGDFERKLVALGVREDTHGTLLGAGHKAFLDARAVVGDNTKAAIEEVERGEDYLRDEITKRLEDKDLSADARGFLTATLPKIKPGHDRISALKRGLN